MKKFILLIPDIFLTVIYFLVFLTISGTDLPSPVWVSLGFVLISHLAFWGLAALQAGGAYSYTNTWTLSMPCLIYIILTSVLAVAFTLLSFEMKPVLVTHTALLLLFLAVCIPLHLASRSDSSGSA